MTATRPLLSVVDDDGYAAQTFASAEEFLAAGAIETTRCLILDCAMPGMSGPDLQRELKRRKQMVPIVFITAHEDAPLRRRVIERGAVACLMKPFSDTALLAALHAALPAS